MWLVSDHVGEGRVTIGTFEWRCTENHLVGEDADTPPVYGGGMAATFDDFGCDVSARRRQLALR